MACLLMVGALAFVATNTQAAEGTISGTVNIECQEKVVQSAALHFGEVTVPDAGQLDTWKILATDGQTLIHVVDGGGIQLQAASKGAFLVSGSHTVNLTFTEATDLVDLDGNDELRIYDITFAIGQTDLTLPYDVVLQQGDCDSPVTISVGGSLDVGSGATTGTHNVATITLHGDYTPFM